MALTDLRCKTAKPSDKPRKMADGGALYLLVKPNGSKLWRLNYRFGGKHKTLSFGAYPVVSLAMAREKRLDAKRVLAEGRDPAIPADALEGGVSFEAVAREWHRLREGNWVPAHAARIISRLEGDIFPEIGNRPIDQIEAPEILAALRKVEARGVADTVKRLRQYTGAIFRFAIATDRAKRNPAADLVDALRPPPRVQHRAALKAHELPDFYTRLRKYDGEPSTAMGLELIIHTMVRTSELRFAKWSELDGDVWRIPAERMKMRLPHIVPLTPQSSDLLKRLREQAKGSEWILPGQRGQPISENTLLFCLYRLGFHSRATVHGFRGLASTVLNESGKFGSDAIERQLAHVPANEIRAAYNAAQYLPERRRMMRWWSDFLTEQAELGELLG